MSDARSSQVALSRGKVETQLLKMQIEDQLNRLLTQLEDLDELKDEFEEKEWLDTREETLQQLREFEAFMQKSMKGDMTLVDEFGSAQLAIQAAISEAFKTPEVIRMFANKDNEQLRKRLGVLQREMTLKHITKEAFQQSAAEILIALKKLGTELTPEEKSFLEKLSSARHLETAVDKLGSGVQRNLMSAASSQIEEAKQ